MRKRIIRLWLQACTMCFAILATSRMQSLAEGVSRASVRRAADSPKSEGVTPRSKQQGSKAGAASSGQGKRRRAVQSANAGPIQDEVALLKRQLAEQQKQIEMLRAAVADQKQLMERAIQSVQFAPASQNAASRAPNLGQVASLAAVIPVAPKAATTGFAATSYPALSPAPDPAQAPVTQADLQGYVKKIDTMDKTVDTLNKGLARFRFSGDLRYRFDAQLRSGNSVAGPLQNVRERYRLRFNVNKAINDQFDFHLQLGSGTFNNPLTYDTDFAGTFNRGPIFITEYYAGYHNKYVELRGGKMEEVFSDNSRFLYDDDVRFNGFHEIVKVPFQENPLGIRRLEFRAGEYILTNPNILILPSSAQCVSPTPPANCAYVNVGFPPGGKVRDTILFHPGFAVYGNLGERWSHQLIGDLQWYRNPTEIQLASTAGGFPLLINGYYGLTLSGPVGQAGNATTTPDGGLYTARNFQIVRLNYRITHNGWKTSRQNFPVWLDLQASRNVGVSFERNAYMGSLGVGEVKKFGDVRFLYIYGVKQANSIISQVTDDDLGTGTGVNIRTHNLRVDLGLTKFLQWQNLLFIQGELSPNDPVRRFFVPLQKGADTTYRIQSQFQFSF